MKRPFNRRSFRLRQRRILDQPLSSSWDKRHCNLRGSYYTLQATAHTAATLAVVLPVPNVAAGAFVPTVHEFPAITARRRAFEVNRIKFLLEESK